MPKDDFFSIKDLERENIKKNIDSVLITFVTEILRLNNYVIGFLKGIGKVQLITELKLHFLNLFKKSENLVTGILAILTNLQKFTTHLEIRVYRLRDCHVL